MTAEENKAIVGRYFQEFHHGREHHVLEEIMTPDLLEGTRQVTEMLLSAFPTIGLRSKNRSPRGTRSSPCGPDTGPTRENGRVLQAPSRRRASG
jgi:hypothetical protein